MQHAKNRLSGRVKRPGCRDRTRRSASGENFIPEAARKEINSAYTEQKLMAGVNDRTRISALTTYT